MSLAWTRNVKEMTNKFQVISGIPGEISAKSPEQKEISRNISLGGRKRFEKSGAASVELGAAAEISKGPSVRSLAAAEISPTILFRA
jgi:hypothetical protein